MPPDTGGMVTANLRILITATALTLLIGGHVAGGLSTTQQVSWTAEQRALVDFGIARFEEQGLDLPDVEIVFRDSLIPCHLQKGLYRVDRLRVEMCTLDKHTMLHELAHAWARSNLSSQDMQHFVTLRGLDSWNDQDDPWKRRGTENVAETIAWGLSDDSRLVKWVDRNEDGTKTVSYRLLTIDVDVETLMENFQSLTGGDSVFRSAEKWSDVRDYAVFSPEARRLRQSGVAP